MRLFLLGLAALAIGLVWWFITPILEHLVLSRFVDGQWVDVASGWGLVGELWLPVLLMAVPVGWVWLPVARTLGWLAIKGRERVQDYQTQWRLQAADGLQEHNHQLHQEVIALQNRLEAAQRRADALASVEGRETALRASEAALRAAQADLEHQRQQIEAQTRQRIQTAEAQAQRRVLDAQATAAAAEARAAAAERRQRNAVGAAQRRARQVQRLKDSVP